LALLGTPGEISSDCERLKPEKGPGAKVPADAGNTAKNQPESPLPGSNHTGIVAELKMRVDFTNQRRAVVRRRADALGKNTLIYLLTNFHFQIRKHKIFCINDKPIDISRLNF